MANGHGGARAGGGRPSLVDEQLRKRVIEKSWDIVEKFYDDPNEDVKDKLKVASYLAGKSVPQDVNLGGQADNPLSVVNLVTINDDCAINKASVTGD
jgi:hypothetical protein